MKNIIVSLVVCAALLLAAVQAQNRNRGRNRSRSRGDEAIARLDGYGASDGYTVWARRVFRRRPASPEECAVACTALGARCSGFTYHKRHRACFGRRRIPSGLGSSDDDSDVLGGQRRGGRFAIKRDPNYVTYYKRNAHDDLEVPDRARGRHHETTTSSSRQVTSRPATSRPTDVRQPRPSSRRPIFGSNRSFAKSTVETTTTAATATTRRSWLWRPRSSTTQRPERITTTTDEPVTERTTRKWLGWTRKTRPRTTTPVPRRRNRPTTTTTTTRSRTRPYTTTTTRPTTTTEATTTTTTEKSGFVWFWNRNKDTKTTTTTAQPETTTRRRRTRPTTTLRTTTERRSRLRTRPTTTTTATTTTRRRTRPRTTTRAPTTARRTRPRTRFTTTTRPTTTTTTTTTQRRTRPRTTTTTERTTTTTTTTTAAPSSASRKCRGRPIGMESGALSDEAFTASSYYFVNYPSSARLNDGSAWIPTSSDEKPYLEITLDEPRKITGVAMQGQSSFFSGAMYVKSYEMDYKDSTRDSEFSTYKDRRGNSEIEGCSDGSTPVRHDFRSHVIADVIRIRPVEWQRSAAVRAELYVDEC